MEQFACNSQVDVLRPEIRAVFKQQHLMSADASHRRLTGKFPRAFPFVGRTTELDFLMRRFSAALRGERQLVFLSGPPGIGKTTLVETFLRGLESGGRRLTSENPDVSPLPTLDPRLQTLASRLWIGHGQCIEHYGAGEAYLPLLEALSRLGREPGGEAVVSVLARYAPAWLAQLPGLVSDQERRALPRILVGVTRERMLREIAEALEELSLQRPLVLVLEDLHRSDLSTLEMLAYVARRQDSARLLILGTYRPAEVGASKNPLRGIVQELQGRGHCTELRLGLLNEAHVTQYLAARLAGGAQRATRWSRLERKREPSAPAPGPWVPSPLVGEACPERSRKGQDEGGQGASTVARSLTLSLSREERGNLEPKAEEEWLQVGGVQATPLHRIAQVIHQRTEGNPLFVVTVVEQWVREGLIAETAGRWRVRADLASLKTEVPDTLRRLIEQQFDNLGREDQRVLEIASVAGVEFEAAAVAAAAAQPVEVVEKQCLGLAARGQFIREQGVAEWPNGTLGGRYRFLHVLYQNVLYERVAEAQRIVLHRRIGDRKEAAYGDASREIVAELAMHFEAGRDYQRAIKYLARAGETEAPEEESEKRRWGEEEEDGQKSKSPNLSAQRSAVFRRDGKYWTVTFDGVMCRLDDTFGMRYLAALLRRPHQAVHVRELTGEPLPSTSLEPTGDKASLRPTAPDQKRPVPPSERARVNVTRAIKTAIKKLTRAHSALGAYLTATIKTGTTCSYSPTDSPPITWQV